MFRKMLILFAVLNLNIFSLSCDPGPFFPVKQIQLHVPKNPTIGECLVPDKGPTIVVSSSDELPILDLDENAPFSINETFGELLAEFPYNTPIAIAVTKYLNRKGQPTYRIWDNPAVLNSYLFNIKPTDSITPESIYFRVKRDPLGNFCVGSIHYMVLTVNPDGTISQKYLGTDKDAFGIPEDLETKALINLILPNLANLDSADSQILEQIAKHYEEGKGTVLDLNEARKYRNLALPRSKTAIAPQSETHPLDNTRKEHPQKITIDPKSLETIKVNIKEQNDANLPGIIAIVKRKTGATEVHCATTLNEKIFPKDIFTKKETFDVVILDPTIADIQYFTVFNGKQRHLCSLNDLFVSGCHPDQFSLQAQTCPQVTNNGALLADYGTYYYKKSKENHNPEKKQKNETQAFQLFKMSANIGNVIAKNNLALFYATGIGTHQNLQLALNILEEINTNNHIIKINLENIRTTIEAYQLLEKNKIQQASELMCKINGHRELKSQFLEKLKRWTEKHKNKSYLLRLIQDEKYIECLEATLLIRKSILDNQ